MRLLGSWFPHRVAILHKSADSPMDHYEHNYIYLRYLWLKSPTSYVYSTNKLRIWSLECLLSRKQFIYLPTFIIQALKGKYGFQWLPSWWVPAPPPRCWDFKGFKSFNITYCKVACMQLSLSLCTFSWHDQGAESYVKMNFF